MRRHLTGLVWFVCMALVGANAAADTEVFELRTYTTNEGKLDDLHARFRDHTMTLFEKHGIRNVAYFTPAGQPNTLVYIVAHPSREAAGAAWRAFGSDPAWRKVAAASNAGGRLIAGITNQFLAPTAYSNAQTSADISSMGSSRLYELRTYTTNPGKLPDLHARFSDHTMELFERHGMANVVYTTPIDDDAPANTLVYLISHADADAAAESWQAFVRDPDWTRVYADSRRNGPLLIEGGVVNQFLVPTDYSQLQ